MEEKFIGWNGLNGKHDSRDILNEIFSVGTDEELLGNIYFQDLLLGDFTHQEKDYR